MNELVEFLLARVAEDEAVARAATVTPWWYDPSKFNSVDHEESVFAGERGPGAITVCSTGPCDDLESMADANHIARHDPTRVLAECKAKRQLIANALERTRILSDGQGPPEMIHDLRVMAEVYADHDGYHEEWRP